MSIAETKKDSYIAAERISLYALFCAQGRNAAFDDFTISSGPPISGIRPRNTNHIHSGRSMPPGRIA